MINKLIVVFISLYLGNPILAQNSASWPIFRGTQQLTGVTDMELPSQPKLLWVFQSEDNIKSAPVVEQGKIVVGSTDGFVYCIDLNGKLIWKFNTGNAIEAPALILDGTVYVGNLDGNLFALHLST